MTKNSLKHVVQGIQQYGNKRYEIEFNAVGLRRPQYRSFSKYQYRSSQISSYSYTKTPQRYSTQISNDVRRLLEFFAFECFSELLGLANTHNIRAASGHSQVLSRTNCSSQAQPNSPSDASPKRADLIRLASGRTPKRTEVFHDVHRPLHQIYGSICVAQEISSPRSLQSLHGDGKGQTPEDNSGNTLG